MRKRFAGRVRVVPIVPGGQVHQSSGRLGQVPEPEVERRLPVDGRTFMKLVGWQRSPWG